MLQLAAVLAWTTLPSTPAGAAYQPVTTWGTPGTGQGEFAEPFGVAVDSAGDVYVADRDNDRVQKFAADGTYITEWGTTGTALGELDDPSDVAVEPAGTVLVADRANNRIQRFSSSGTPLAEFGAIGSGGGFFNGPEGVGVDSAGNIYVADTFQGRVQKLNSAGTFLLTWGWDVGIGAPTTFEVCTSSCKAGVLGSGDGQFNNVYDVAVDATGSSYVVDANHRLQRFSSTPAFLSTWGTQGALSGQFGFGGGATLAVGPNGSIFVADHDNSRVQVFTPDGTFVEEFGGTATLTRPVGVAIAPDGSVYVTDRIGNRVVRFLDDTPPPGTPPPATPEPTPPAASADLPAPVLGEKVNVRLVSGTVLLGVRGEGSAARAAQKGVRFVPLTEARQIPVGSFLDTKRGTVSLTSAADDAGATQAGSFSKGLFQVLQARSGKERGLTELRLKGSRFTNCAVEERASAAARKRLKSRTVRRLQGDADGRFRTRGRHSSATVRGTIWTVIDRCDGTLTRVKRGKVAVRDFRRKKTIVVKAGKRYLARAR